jgi:hypothetical protein
MTTTPDTGSKLLGQQTLFFSLFSLCHSSKFDKFSSTATRHISRRFAAITKRIPLLLSHIIEPLCEAANSRIFPQIGGFAGTAQALGAYNE